MLFTGIWVSISDTKSIPGLSKQVNKLWIMRARVFKVKKKVKRRKKKSRIKIVVLNWIWRYQCELTVFNIYIKYTNRYVRVYVCKKVQSLSYLEKGKLKQH